MKLYNTFTTPRDLVINKSLLFEDTQQQIIYLRTPQLNKQELSNKVWGEFASPPRKHLEN